MNGVTGTAETAEAMATMSIGMVAGSAIMLLTLVWGSVVAFGSYDISESQTSNQVNKKGFSITGILLLSAQTLQLEMYNSSVVIVTCQYMCFADYGVTTDSETRSTARIMMVSLIPFLVLQVAKVLNSTSGIRIVILVSLIVSVAFLVTYCIYQVQNISRRD